MTSVLPSGKLSPLIAKMAAISEELAAWINRGKRATATHLRSVPRGNKLLDELLQNVFDPIKTIDDFDNLEWYRALIAGGRTYDEFDNLVRQYDNATTCGLVWTANFVAYRCRTCGITPCMSLCSKCFQEGNHEGHDYNMFRSKAGGACDCGDSNVLDPSGFCARHGPGRSHYQQVPPQELIFLPELIMPKLFIRLLYHLREYAKSDVADVNLQIMQEADQYLSFLHSLCDMGAVMMKVMGQALTNPAVYETFIQTEGQYHTESEVNYLQALKDMVAPSTFLQFTNVKGLGHKLVHTTLLDELVFWMVKFELPQKMVTLLLSLLPDENYKQAFTKAFVLHYSRVSLVLVRSKDHYAVGHRVVHISVQLFSNESLARKMCREYNLQYILVLSLRHMVETILTESTLQNHVNYHHVVDCGYKAMKDHCYWPIVSDLINLLSHRSVALKFMDSTELIKIWLNLLLYFQGCNLNQRELTQHVEFEPDTYYAAFSAELEMSASPMSYLISHCKDKDTAEYSRVMIHACLETLQDWFDSINFLPKSKPNSLQLAFHLPLHRYLATFIAHAVQHQNVSLDELLPPADMLKCLLMFPLRIQVGMAEIAANMWLRNGLQIRGQAMTYVQCHFCYSMLDADLFLMQVCAAKLDPDDFVQTVIDSFHLSNWLSFSPQPIVVGVTLEAEQEMTMVENALFFLAMLQSVRTYLGLTEKELVHVEMVALLCVNDRTHSQLMDLMPEKSGLAIHGRAYFEQTLKMVADYKAPVLESGGGLQQGTYVPKNILWEKEFDPIQVSTRSVYKKDVQSSMDRYQAYLKHSGKYSGKSPPWPPLKIPGKILPAYDGLRQILHCRTLHGFLFSVLYRAVKDSTVSESVTYFCVFLLELGTRFQPTEVHEYHCEKCVHDGDYRNWFPSNCLVVNAQHRIHEIILDETSDTEDEEPHQTASSLFAGQTLSEEFFVASRIAAPLKKSLSSKLKLSGSKSNGDGDSNAESSNVKCSSGADIPKCQSTIVVKESIISLLMKLHSKLSGKKESSYIPLSMRKSSERLPDEEEPERIGDGPYYIGLLLDRLTAQDPMCVREMERVVHEMNPKIKEKVRSEEKGTITSEDLDKEERRKKARERRQKLMEEFASKQKAFMEQAMDMDEMTEEPSESCKQSSSEEEYHCSICGRSVPSTPERPMGLVVLLLATSVLGHCPKEDQQQPLPISNQKTRTPPQTCASVKKKQLELLVESYTELSVTHSVNIGWEGGVLVQSCGHYLHMDCHKQYIESLKGPYFQQTLAVNNGEYWCPLCRQLANAVIPMIPDSKKIPLTLQPDVNDLHKMAQDVERMMQQQSESTVSSLFQSSILDDLTKATYSMYKRCCEQYKTQDSIRLFLASIARTNLEMELLHYENKLMNNEPLACKPKFFMPLFHVLSHYAKSLTTVPYTDLWAAITGVNHSATNEVTINFQPNTLGKVPILLRDPIALLIDFLLQLPMTMSKDHFSYLVNTLYNIAYIQALLVTSCSFMPDERAAWCKKQMSNSLQDLGGMMSHVITRLRLSHLYDDKDVSLGCISQWVWSPDTVETMVEDFLLPFLQIAALLQRHLFNEELPSGKCSSEFTYLCTYLRLGSFHGSIRPGSPWGAAASSASVEQSSKADSFVRFSVPEILPLTRSWLNELATAIDSNRAFKNQYLLPFSYVYYQPHLLTLPSQYYKIFQEYRDRVCIMCSTTPKDPAICLVCAHFLCFRESCCQQDSVYECVQHSISCGAGTGVFLLVNSSTVVVIRGLRAALWGSVYLDKHGEEDAELRRGKPLYLSEERYKLLEHQWRTHNFDHACKQWMWHKNSL